MDSKKAVAALQGRGRPSRLTLERLLAAANELGVENLTMKSLASSLGVGIATVYRFASSKDELVRMATIARTKRPGFAARPVQDWRDYVSAFGHELCTMYTDEPQLIALMVSGGIGPEVEAPTLEHFLNALDERGIDAKNAMRLYHAVGALALGSAVAISHNRALRAAGTPRTEQLKEIADEAGYEGVARNLEVIAAIEEDVGFGHALDMLLTGFTNAGGPERCADA